MLAVSDTSPISNLASIGRLNLLQAQFSEVRIPPAVAAELTSHPDKAASAAIDASLRQWVSIVTPQDTPLQRMLRRLVDPGEAEAIALASDLCAAIVIIDELEGRILARQLGLSITGTLGILLRAKRNGQLPLIKPEIQALRDRARFFLSASLEAEVLSAAGE
jgi:predicted nucleic acid-binding protein